MRLPEKRNRAANAQGLRCGVRRFRSALTLIVALALLATGFNLHARMAGEPDAAAVEARLEQLRDEIRSLAQAREKLDVSRSRALRELREADRKVAEESRELEALEERIAEHEAGLKQLEAERDALQERLSSEREALAEILRSAYALGDNERLKLLLAQDDFQLLARMQGYHRYFQRDRERRTREVMEALSELADVLEQLEQQSEQLRQEREKHDEQVAQLAAQRDERRRVLAGLEQRTRDADDRMAALDRDEQAMQELLEQLTDVFADIPDELEAAQPFASQKGRLERPLSELPSVRFGGQLPNGHPSQGWLILVPAGTGVQAIGHGRVAFADWLKGYGLLVIVDHGDGFMSLYAHNDALQREVGDWVEAGDVLAQAGSSGGLNQPGLYFELRRDGQPVDPQPWFRH